MDEIDLTTAQSYRLNMIESIQNEIELEREKRTALSERYNKGCIVVDAVQHVLIIGTIGFGATSLGAIGSVIGIPLAIAMDIGAMTAGILSIASSRIGKYVRTKKNKHAQIRMLAEAKLSTISDHISKAIEDHVISEGEYTLILTEYNKYNATKDAIRLKTKQAIQEQQRDKA